MEISSFLSTETLIATTIFAVTVWYYVHRKWKYFEDLGIPYVKPSVLKLGTALGTFTDPFGDEAKSKKKFGSVYGSFFLTRPSIVVHDPDMLRQIFIKEFRNFSVRSKFFTKSNGKELNEGLTVTEGEQWKRCRSSITPIFSSSKLKQMHGILNDCTDQMMDELEQECKDNTEFEARKIFGSYSLNIVLSAVFNAQTKNSGNGEENETVKYAKKIFDIRIFKSPLLILLLLFPSLERITSLFNATISDKSALNYFKKLSLAIMKRHKEHPEESKRIDVMKMMIDLQVAEEQLKDLHSGKGLTETEIIGNAMLMIVAGYENTANTIGFLAYNLAMHPEVQEKVQQEIDEAVDEQGNISYEALKEMKYLEMCLNESLRLYSPILKNGRICTNDTTINGIPFKKDQFVNIPIFALHRDPEFWNEPDEFQPERMSDMTKVDPMVYQPFGNGPRNCIAIRFAKIEVKLAIAKILSKYTLKPSDDTPKPPLKLTFKASVSPKNEIKLKIEKRNLCM